MSYAFHPLADIGNQPGLTTRVPKRAAVGHGSDVNHARRHHPCILADVEMGTSGSFKVYPDAELTVVSAILPRDGQSPDRSRKSGQSQPVDDARQVSGAEAVVNVDHGDVGRATVHHAHERRETPETRAVADAGGHG